LVATVGVQKPARIFLIGTVISAIFGIVLSFIGFTWVPFTF